MHEINLFSGYLAQGTQVQRVQAAEKEQQRRRAEALENNVALEDDQLEHQVESAEKVTAVDDRSPPNDPRGERRASPGAMNKPDNEDRPTIDLKA